MTTAGTEGDSVPVRVESFELTPPPEGHPLDDGLRIPVRNGGLVVARDLPPFPPELERRAR